MDLKSKFQKSKAPKSGRSLKITADNFFIEDNPKGYFSTEDFLYYADGLEGNEPEQFVEAIKQLAKGTRIKYDPTIRTHQETGAKYMWIECQYAKATRGFKVVAHEAISRLVEDYAMGTINIDFNIDDLIDRASLEAEELKN